MDKLYDYIISIKRNTDIDELKPTKIDGEPNHLHEHYKNDKKALKPMIEMKKPFSIGTMEQSRNFLNNLCEDIEKYEETRDKNRLLKGQNKSLRKMYVHMRNLLERQKNVIDCDLIEDEDIIQEKSVLSDDEYFIMFKKNIELTDLLQKHKNYKEDMDKKFEDLEELYKKDYHKSFMCQEHIEEIDSLRKELEKSKINEQTYKELFNEHKNRGDNYYKLINELETKKIEDMDVSEKLAQTEEHNKQMKTLKNNYKEKLDKELDQQEKQFKKQHYKEIQELKKIQNKELQDKDKFIQKLFTEITELRMSKSMNDDKD